MNDKNVNLAALDLNLLSVLHALLTTQSVSEAANLIGRTQPATSHALRRLRLYFGDPLLVRDGWQMHLTPLGENLKQPVSEAVFQVRRVFDKGEEFDPSASTRRMKIATPDLCVPLFSPFLARLSQLAPLMSVEFCSPNDFRQAITNQEADLALGFGDLTGNATVHCQSVKTLTWAVFAPEDHPYAESPDSATWCESTHISVTGRGKGSGPIERVAQENRLQRRIFMHAPSFLTGLVMCKESNALLTTLQQPFAEISRALGLVALPTPFDMPSSSATLIHRAPLTNAFELWLSRLASETLK